MIDIFSALFSTVSVGFYRHISVHLCQYSKTEESLYKLEVLMSHRNELIIL